MLVLSELISGNLNRSGSAGLYLPIRYLYGSNKGANLKNISFSFTLSVSIFLILQLYRYVISSLLLSIEEIYHL